MNWTILQHRSKFPLFYPFKRFSNHYFDYSNLWGFSYVLANWRVMSKKKKNKNTQKKQQSAFQTTFSVKNWAINESIFFLLCHCKKARSFTRFACVTDIFKEMKPFIPGLTRLILPFHYFLYRRIKFKKNLIIYPSKDNNLAIGN